MRRVLLMAGFAASLMVQTPALAQSAQTADVIAQIEADGYTVTDVRRSWLGRIVITATKDTDLREVVVNRTSGEVLRDQRFANEIPRDNPPRPEAGTKGDRNTGDQAAGRDETGRGHGPSGRDGKEGPGGRDGASGGDGRGGRGDGDGAGRGEGGSGGRGGG